ncbi:MAG: hypothetical protein ACYS80_23830, partial [Planctomycetota bacterium]
MGTRKSSTHRQLHGLTKGGKSARGWFTLRNCEKEKMMKRVLLLMIAALAVGVLAPTAHAD